MGDESQHMELRPERRIQVLFIIDSLWGPGGAELSLLELIRKLPPARYQCRVITFNTNRDARLFLDQFPCPVMHWDLGRFFSIRALRFVLKLRHLVRRELIDVVHTFFTTSDVAAGPLAKLFGAKVLISSRRDLGILRGASHRFAYGVMSRFCDQIQTVSEEVRRFTLRNDGVLAERVMTVHNGIDADQLRAKANNTPASSLTSSEAPTILSVASCRRVKGLDVLVRAAAIVAAEIPEVRFYVAGRLGVNAADRQYTEEVLTLRETLAMNRTVQFLGERSDVPALLNSAKAFVLPSRSEGLPNALLEAMAFGLPCVASRVGGTPEVLEDGNSGFLFESENAQDLAQAILRILREPATARRLGRNARKRIEEWFTCERMAEQVSESYEMLLAAKQAKKTYPDTIASPNAHSVAK